MASLDWVSDNVNANVTDLIFSPAFWDSEYKNIEIDWAIDLMDDKDLVIVDDIVKLSDSSLKEISILDDTVLAVK